MASFKEQLPGLTVHINEGRLLGTFDLPPADMQHIRYHGRQVIVIVADAEKVAVADTKDGDTKASWTFKAVDAAIVRDQGMVDHLANVLYLDGLEELDPAPVTTIPGGPAPFASTPNVSGGVDLLHGGAVPFDDFGEDLEEVIPDPSAQDEKVPPLQRGDLEDVIPDSTDPGPRRKPAGPGPGPDPGPRPDEEDDERVFRAPATTRPIQNRDKLLERFPNDERVGSGLK